VAVPGISGRNRRDPGQGCAFVAVERRNLPPKAADLRRERSGAVPHRRRAPLDCNRRRAASDHAVMVAPGDIVRDRYRIDALVARDASADVFRVHDLVVGRRAVLKLLRTGNVDPRWFDREVRVLARVEHPNVGRLDDAGRHGPVPFVVLEYIDGSTLAERLERGPLEVSEARDVAYDIASALAHIHARGLAHGDVTPSTILLADRRVMLADPGVARLGGGRGAAGSRSAAGDPTQVQVGGSEHVGAGDIYALGLVLVAALSTQPPVTNDDDATAVIGHVSPEHVTRAEDLPAAWRSLLAGMLDPDPAARPDAGALMAKLARESAAGPEAPSAETQVLSAEAVLRGERRAPGHLAETPPDADRAPNGLMRQPVMWALVALATLAALAAIVMGRELSDGAPSDPSNGAGMAAAVQDGTATTTSPPSTTSDPTTTVPPATTAPTTVAAPTCADIDARKDWLDDQKQQLDDLYPDDKDLREEVKGQIEDEKRALEDYERTLDC
jgi:serine/threonine-protein kinase